MITRRKRYIYDRDERTMSLKDIVLDKKDYGVSFVDYLEECDIEGHEPDILSAVGKDFTQRCRICGLERDVKVIRNAGSYLGRDMLHHWQLQEQEYGEWHEAECPECEENCIVSRPMDNFKCPNCHKERSWDITGLGGLIHTGKDDKLLFDCGMCDAQDQIIA